MDWAKFGDRSTITVPLSTQDVEPTNGVPPGQAQDAVLLETADEWEVQFEQDRSSISSQMCGRRDGMFSRVISVAPGRSGLPQENGTFSSQIGAFRWRMTPGRQEYFKYGGS